MSKCSSKSKKSSSVYEVLDDIIHQLENRRSLLNLYQSCIDEGNLLENVAVVAKRTEVTNIIALIEQLKLKS